MVGKVRDHDPAGKRNNKKSHRLTLKSHIYLRQMSQIDQEKQRIVDSLVRDICSVSVAPGPKSKVRAIVSSGFDTLHAAVVRELREKVEGWLKEDVKVTLGSYQTKEIIANATGVDLLGCFEIAREVIIKEVLTLLSAPNKDKEE